MSEPDWAAVLAEHVLTVREQIAADLGLDMETVVRERLAEAFIEAERATKMTEADKVREALFFDPTVDDETYGRLVEEAADADERASWRAEADEEEA